MYVSNCLIFAFVVHTGSIRTKIGYKSVKHSLIVFPSDLSHQEKCFQYWPSEGSVTFGDYTVELTGDTQCETFTLKDMVLTYRPVRNVLHTAYCILMKLNKYFK